MQFDANVGTSILPVCMPRRPSSTWTLEECVPGTRLARMSGGGGGGGIDVALSAGHQGIERLSEMSAPPPPPTKPWGFRSFLASAVSLAITGGFSETLLHRLFSYRFIPRSHATHRFINFKVVAGRAPPRVPPDDSSRGRVRICACHRSSLPNCLL